LLPHSHAALPFNGNAWTSPAWSKLTRNAFAFSDQKDNRNSDEEKRSKEEKEE
jgi:ATP-dependent metalloprotease FtsH